jgi:asparagine synthase (glutamine-hydrolysing)
MSFHVVFNGDPAAVELDRVSLIKPATHERREIILGKARQVGFVWSDSRFKLSLGHQTLLAIIDERYWLIGRVRLDARDEIYAELRLDVRASATEVPDALLCLQAYAHWGDRFLDRLSGDFCFVIWDEDRQQLICARDQLGVRPLFYARTGINWHISDSLEDIASEGAINTELDDYWIADFFGINYCLDVDRTVYKQIKRLPPAHILVVSCDGSSLRKYWTLDVPEPLYYRNPAQYIEQFHEVLGLAIVDRLPPNRVGIWMSGGLDSSTLAAHALRATGNSSRVVAHNLHFESLIPDQEKHFSSLVADKLGIEIVHRAIDDACYDRDWHTRDIQTPEPNLMVTCAAPRQLMAEEMSSLADVWFYGEGPDNALQFEWKPYLRWLAGRRDWNGLAHAAVEYVRGKQMREWHASVKRAFCRSSAQSDAQDEVPEWLSMAFAKNVSLSDRFSEYRRQTHSDHAWHPRAMASFNSSIWAGGFLEQCDPIITKTPLDWRHPYLDLRVLTFLLSVPPIPWARRKRLLRDAMRGVLPDEVIRRDKMPLVVDPFPIARQKCLSLLPQLSRNSPIWQYVDAGKFRDMKFGKSNSDQLLKIYVFDAWLSGRSRIEPQYFL